MSLIFSMKHTGEVFDTQWSEKAAGITSIYAQPARQAVATDGYAF